jgi:hypothetical protein
MVYGRCTPIKYPSIEEKEEGEEGGGGGGGGGGEGGEGGEGGTRKRSPMSLHSLLPLASLPPIEQVSRQLSLTMMPNNGWGVLDQSFLYGVHPKDA